MKFLGVSNETENILSRIETKFLCRNKQIRKLFHYMCVINSPNIVINGPRATGKTSIIQLILDEFQLFHSKFDLINLDHNERCFYEKILFQIKAQIDKMSSAGDSIETEYPKCLNHLDFIDQMTELLKSISEKGLNIPQEKVFIVLDNADILIEEHHETLIYLLNNINQLTNQIKQISIIWITKYPMERLFRLTEFKPNALQVTFDPYTQEELFILLISNVSVEDPYKLYPNFVQLILRTLIPFENSYLSLQHICSKYFKDYCLPIEEDTVCYSKSGQLYVKFQPRLQEIIDRIGGNQTIGWKENVTTCIESLPSSMCYVYLAAYLATYNHTQSDFRFFVRNQKSRAKFRTNNGDSECKFPKWFELERAFHIYRVLIDLNEKDTSIRNRLLSRDDLFFKQIANLFDQRVILSKSASTIWSCAADAKYQLSQAITDGMILEIASKIDLELNAFISHPMEGVPNKN